jgi:murein DD-endopeptidase MepM/ murein hydrolase activator NlpD
VLARLLGIAALLLAAAAPASATTAGGAAPTPAPTVMRVVCVSDCAGATSARPGSVVRLRGRALKLVERVVFQGARGAADDTDAVPVATRSASVDVVVPRTAVSGRLLAVNADGEQSHASAKTALTVEPGTPGSRAGLRSAGGAPEIDVEVQTHKVFFGAERRATIVYLVRDSGPVTVRIELVRLEDAAVVAHWEPGLVAPDAPQTVAWDGLVDGLVPKDGRFAFRVYAENAQGVRAQTASSPEAVSSSSFFFARHRFPIRGPHSYGEFAAAFGGGRGHQGQDVFARCGTQLVAARGGVVKIKQAHPRAGNYVVIDGDGTDVDYVYMHLRRPAVVDKGDRVFTGQVIGEVGDTGRATGCHLHFEMWTGPGWYTGGSPFDPLPSLRVWDAHS